jgi:hypothetical protein
MSTPDGHSSACLTPKKKFKKLQNWNESAGCSAYLAHTNLWITFFLTLNHNQGRVITPAFPESWKLFFFSGNKCRLVFTSRRSIKVVLTTQKYLSNTSIAESIKTKPFHKHFGKIHTHSIEQVSEKSYHPLTRPFLTSFSGALFTKRKQT